MTVKTKLSEVFAGHDQRSGTGRKGGPLRIDSCANTSFETWRLLAWGGCKGSKKRAANKRYEARSRAENRSLTREEEAAEGSQRFVVERGGRATAGEDLGG